jgi:hypothetical protein
MTRSFESTGPDTKIRGRPSDIAEKYMALARDALSSGDPVLAENYLQHAEHYNRIIMAYREQMQQSGEYNGGPQPMIARFRPGPHDPMGGDEAGEAEGEDFVPEGQPQPIVRGNDPQPSVFEGAPPREYTREGQRDDRPREGQREGQRYDNRNEGQQRHQGHHSHGRSGGGERSYGHDRRDRYDRNDRNDRNDRGDRGERGDRQDRSDRPDRSYDRPAPSPDVAAEPSSGQSSGPRRSGGSSGGSRSGAPQPHEQPEFLRRPVRRSRREDEEGEGSAAAAPDPVREE